MKNIKGFTLIELMIVIAIIAVIAAIAIPGLLRARIAANERSASTSLKVVVTAEEGFMSTDMDRNGINDYWTGDLGGLFAMRFTATDKPIAALSDLGIYYADTYRLDDMGAFYMGLDMDGDGSGDTLYGPGGGFTSARSPKTGYWFQAMNADALGNPYGLNTDGWGPFHNYGQYGFCALPAAYDSTGNFTFIVDSSGSVFRRDFGINTTVPVAAFEFQTFDGVVPLAWPDAAQLGASWGKVE